MKKTKILLGALSLTAVAPMIPMAVTSCSHDDGSFTPTITNEDKGVQSYETSKCQLNTAFAVYCTCKDGHEIDSSATNVSVGNIKLVLNTDYIIYNNMIIVGSAAMTDKNVSVNIATRDISVVYTVQLFAGTGGKLVGGTTSFNVVQNTKWKDIPNKPTPTAISGYKFVGWYRNETKITDDTIITDNMDIYAWFEKESGTQCYVTVVAGPGGKNNGSSIMVVKSGEKWGNIKPTTTPDSGYEFEGWYLNDQKINDDTIISSNSYIFAWFKSTTSDKCKIRFKCLKGGQLSGTTDEYKDVEIDIGASWSVVKNSVPATAPDTGYTLKDWYANKEETPLTDETTFEDSTYVFGYFEKTELNITIDMTDVQHTTTTTQTISMQASNFNIARETLDQSVQPDEGYALAGWVDEDGNRIFDNYQLATNKTIKPIIVEEYNTYDLNETAGTASVSGRVSGHDQTHLMIPSYVYKNGQWYKVNEIKYQSETGYYDGCSTIHTLCIPNTISNIRDRAFRSCYNLKTIYIPTSVTYFSYHSFYNAKCTSFNYLGTIAQYKKIKNGGWWHQGMSTGTTICIDGVTNIDADA